MNTLTAWLGRTGLDQPGHYKMLAGPLLIIMIMAMMILPLPPFVLDILFTFNIALSVMVLLVSMFTTKPLDFAAFPAVLLFATLLRLSLNVASTRVVLMNGHEGAGAAGQVIESFGEFLVGGNLAVGLIVFLILIVINFMVITKGAGRIAEVGARFTLDALPGKQMAIDADLNAGLIDEKTAKARREETAMEADFYGSMDGASKFVRGDAIAGILIMGINLIGGLIVGIAQHGMSVSGAAKTYTILTIGDGLVAQVPALVISTAAGVTVSRVASEQDVGQQLIGQLFDNPKVMFLAAGVLGLLGLVPGMPNTVFLLFTGLLAGLGWWLVREGRAREAETAEAVPAAAVSAEAEEASWDDVQLVDPLGLEVGYRLISLVDAAQDGELLRRIKGVRKKFAGEVGFLPPVVHIRDNLEFSPHDYRVTLNGVEIGRGEAFVGQFLAIDPGGAVGELEGRAGQDPAFGLPATWIEANKRDNAEAQGFTVVDAATVIATHINHLLTTHAAAMLGRTEVGQLLERVKKDYPDLVDEVVPKPITLATLTAILGNLLSEQVSIRDMRRILDTLAVHGAHTTDSEELTAAVRVALGAAIVESWFGADKQIDVIGLDGRLEQMLTQALSNGGGMEPGLAQTLIDQAEAAARAQADRGLPPVLVVRHDLRPLLARFLRRSIDALVVLSQSEIPDDRQLRVSRVIGQQQ
ncbi:flagellar biosynthesis protein FlhA [Salinisphaera hydrothermalis]|uniref:Flagellar biosynthesis protein FlhA n=1 Tax=Salinisphaera hydrothermalis (strain C41B8) TaxID=1304275 RepID=A0A084IMV6_SALHC|nr:flagellar biosynthesis protein FlhA [Salinisphaera hydrothermalis]KEZ78040.1 flagellar biosynthesis protein A [Salinisphaera hydrothermalis C41B8]